MPQPQPWSYTRQVLIPASTTVGLLLLVAFVWYAGFVLLLAFAGVLLAILLRTAGDAVQWATGLSDRWALSLAILLIVLFLGALGWAVAPRISTQVDQLAIQLPQSLDAIEAELSQYRWGDWLLEQVFRIQESSFTGSDVISRATGVFSQAVSALLSFAVVIFAGVYLAYDPVLYTNGILRLVPPRHRQRGREVLGAIGYTLRWWLIGQLITMTAVGVMTTVALWLLGIPLALVLGMLAFLLDFVPNFGPILAAAPGILLAFTISPTKAIYVAVAYFVVQHIESLLIAPLIHQRMVHLPPVLTITSQILLGILLGPLGLLLATPVTATVLVLVQILYVEETLGDELETPVEQLKPEDKPPLPQ